MGFFKVPITQRITVALVEETFNHRLIDVALLRACGGDHWIWCVAGLLVLCQVSLWPPSSSFALDVVFAVSGLDSCAGEESGNSWWASCRNAGFAGNLSTTFRNPSLKLDSSEVDAY